MLHWISGATDEKIPYPRENSRANVHWRHQHLADDIQMIPVLTVSALHRSRLPPRLWGSRDRDTFNKRKASDSGHAMCQCQDHWTWCHILGNRVDFTSEPISLSCSNCCRLCCQLYTRDIFFFFFFYTEHNSWIYNIAIMCSCVTL